MHIVYTPDNNFARQTGISLLSLLESNNTEPDINIHIAGNFLSEENKAKLKNCTARYGRNITFYETAEIVNLLKQKITTGFSLPITAYVRLFITEILPSSLKRVIYLDGDTLIMDSLHELWEMKFDDNKIVGAVQERTGKVHHDKTIYRYLNLSESDIYINSGVLVLDMEAMREIDVTDKYKAFMELYKYIFLYNDQDVINGVLKGMIQRIDPKYNVSPRLYTKGGRLIICQKSNCENDYFNLMLQHADKPCIIHFTSVHNNVYRPWYEKSVHPYTKKWRECNALSPWQNEPLRPANKGLRMVVSQMLIKMPAFIFAVFYRIRNSNLFFTLEISRLNKVTK